MPALFRRSALSALALGIAGALPVSAEVTPDQVWSAWQEAFRVTGQQLQTGEERSDDGRLTVTGIAFGGDFDVPDPEGGGTIQGGSYTAEIPALTFSPNDDGTVTVTIQPEITAGLTLTPPDEETVSMAFRARHEDLKITVSGTPEEMDTDYTASSFTLIVDRFEAPEDGTVKGGITLRGVTGSTRSLGMGTDQAQSSFAADEAGMTMTIEAPGDDTQVEFTGLISQLKGSSVGPVLASMTTDGLIGLLREGRDITGDFQYGPSRMAIDGTSDGSQVDMDFALDGAEANYDFSDGGLRYDSRTRGLDFSIQADGAPFPITGKIAEYGGGMTVPLVAGEDTRAFGLRFDVTGLTIADELWNIFDPAGQLPRTPITLALDMGGQARLDADLMDPKAQAALEEGGGDMGEVESLSVKRLELAAAGARLTAEGQFDVDAEKPGLNPGMPQIAGAMDINLEGFNALLDTLVAMGLLPQDQAMAARMMTAMFAVPGDAPDTLKSRIELTGEGQVLANGQRIR